jgi:GH43 family beta-xylosidase
MSEVVEIEGRANIDVVIVENSWTLKQHQKERTEKKIRVFFVRATSWGAILC